MRSNRLWIAGACLSLALVGGACGGDGGSPKADAPAATPIATAEQVQAVVTSMTDQILQAAAAAPGTPPPTSDEIKAQLTEQLRQLGITL
jgi:hypothetical protein